MTRKGKIIIGGIVGMLLTRIVSSTYFYGFLRKVIKRLDNSIKDFNY